MYPITEQVLPRAWCRKRREDARATPTWSPSSRTATDTQADRRLYFTRLSRFPELSLRRPRNAPEHRPGRKRTTRRALRDPRRSRGKRGNALSLRGARRSALNALRDEPVALGSHCRFRPRGREGIDFAGPTQDRLRLSTPDRQPRPRRRLGARARPDQLGRSARADNPDRPKEAASPAKGRRLLARAVPAGMRADAKRRRSCNLGTCGSRLRATDGGDPCLAWPNRFVLETY